MHTLSLLILTAASPLAAQSLEIVEAAYGAGNFQMNVAPKLRGMVQNNALDVTVDPALLGGDPAPGSAKRLRVVYRYNNRQLEASAGDFEKLRLPAGAAAPGEWSIGSVPTNAPAAAAPAQAGGFSIGDIWGGGSSLKIVSARYGEASTTRFKDVREYLQSLVHEDRLSVKVDNAAMGGDPAPARAKTLEVVYEYRGARFQAAKKEGAYLALPEVDSSSAAAAPVGLKIVMARYGGDGRFNDVRERLQGMVRNNVLTVKTDNASLGGDPAVGKDKALEVTYESAGVFYTVSAKEGRSLTLPDSSARAVETPAAAMVPAGVRSADSDAARTAAQAPAAVVTGSREIPPVGSAPGLRIFFARYGAPGQEIDVRERFRPLLQNDSVQTVVGAASMGSDPAPGVRKTLTVIYEFKGRTYEKVAADGEALKLPF
jgi:hypothetical protein